MLWVILKYVWKENILENSKVGIPETNSFGVAITSEEPLAS